MLSLREPEWVASSEVGELEYANHEVDPLTLIILTEADGEFYKIKVPLHLLRPTPTCRSQLTSLWKSWNKRTLLEMPSGRLMKLSRFWLLLSHCPFKSRDQYVANREQSGEEGLKRIPI